MKVAKKPMWRKVDYPAPCGCEHTLSLYCGILVSSRFPKHALPATPCPCGKTVRRWKDGQLFSEVSS